MDAKPGEGGVEVEMATLQQGGAVDRAATRESIAPLVDGRRSTVSIVNPMSDDSKRHPSWGHSRSHGSKHDCFTAYGQFIHKQALSYCISVFVLTLGLSLVGLLGKTLVLENGGFETRGTKLSTEWRQFELLRNPVNDETDPHELSYDSPILYFNCHPETVMQGGHCWSAVLDALNSGTPVRESRMLSGHQPHVTRTNPNGKEGRALQDMWCGGNSGGLVKVLIRADGGKTDVLTVPALQELCRVENTLWPQWSGWYRETSSYDYDFNRTTSEECVPHKPTSVLNLIPGYLERTPGQYDCSSITQTVVDSLRTDLTGCCSLQPDLCELDVHDAPPDPYAPGNEELLWRCASMEQEGGMPVSFDYFSASAGAGETPGAFAVRMELLVTTWEVDPFLQAYKDNWVDLMEEVGEDFILLIMDKDGELADPLADQQLIMDASLSAVAIVIVFLGVWFQTRSFFLTCMGIMHVVLSFPLAMFWFRIVLGYNDFPFLNLMGLFVIAGIGADDIFVITDKFKQATSVLGEQSSVSERLVYALRHGVVAMGVTSLTTMAAFAANAISPVQPIRLFSVFMATLVLSNYILVITMYPACIVLHQRFFIQPGRAQCTTSARVLDKCIRSSNEGVLPTAQGEGKGAEKHKVEKETGMSNLTAVQKALGGPLFRTVAMARWPIVVVFLALVGVAAWRGSSIALPEEEISLWPDDHPITLARRTERDHFLPVNDAYMAFQSVWGLQPADTGNHNEVNDRGVLVLSDGGGEGVLDPLTLSNILASCHHWEGGANGAVRANTTVCLLSAFADWYGMGVNRTEDGDHRRTQTWEDGSVVDEGYCTSPSLGNVEAAIQAGTYDKTRADTCLRFFLNMDEAQAGVALHDEWRTGVWYNEAGVPIIATAFTETTLTRKEELSPVALRKVYDTLEPQWEEAQDGKTLPSGQDAYFTSWQFTWMDLTERLASDAYAAAGLSILLAFLVLLGATRNLRTATAALLCIVGVIAFVLASIVSMGWTLGVLESLCMAILAGVSVDFVLHLAHQYQEIHDRPDRKGKMQSTLATVGVSVLYAGGTTLAATMMLLPGTIQFFPKFGTFLALTIVYAMGSAFLGFTAFQAIVGQQHTKDAVWWKKLL